jgi:superfamily II DNA helicase RecQ
VRTNHISGDTLHAVSEVIGLKENSSHKTGIVYCSTRKRVEAVAEALKMAKISSILYHGGMNDEEREQDPRGDRGSSQQGRSQQKRCKRQAEHGDNR